MPTGTEFVVLVVAFFLVLSFIGGYFAVELALEVLRLARGWWHGHEHRAQLRRNARTLRYRISPLRHEFKLLTGRGRNQFRVPSRRDG